MKAEKICLFLLAVTCLSLIAGAVWLQVEMGEQPCPLCIVQRYALLFVAIWSLVGVLSKSWRSMYLFTSLAWISGLAGFFVAARHVYIQWFPLTSCGIDTLEPVVDALPLAKLLPLVFQVDGFCETPYPPILGLSLAQWALIAFATMTLLIPAGVVYSRRTSELFGSTARS